MLSGYNTQILTVNIADPAADLTIPLIKAPTGLGLTIHKVYAATTTAVAANGSNLVTCSLINGGADGSETTEIAVRTGGASVGWDANELHELTISADGLDAGDQLMFKYDETGTVAPGRVTVTVHYNVGGNS